MKKITLLLLITGASFLGNLTAKAQTAELQVIHNAADPAAATVDIYVDGTLTLNDFTFRSASPFVSLPAGISLNIGVAPPSSSSVNDTIKNFEVTLSSGQRYVAIANGVLDTSTFASNPDGISTGFTLFIQDNIRSAAGSGMEVDFIVLHGATDAPAVDVIARNVATLVDNASYSAITPYVSVPADTYTLDVTPAAGSPIVASFLADLSSLGGGSAVVFASGFLDPAGNQNGEAFGLFAALANGTVVPFPATSTARLQVIHNAADPAAATVDVYVNGSMLLDDFAFRTATPYVDVPAGVVLNIGIAPGNSTSVNDTLKNFEVTLVNGGTYLAVANGVLNPANFAANPDGRATAFTLFLQDQMAETASGISDVDLRVVHGASDAPTVDVVVGGNVLVDNAAYGDITGYLTVPAGNYQLDITPGNDNSIIVASFSAPLNALGGSSAVILASGFLDPAMNQNGTPFALIAVLADGTVIVLTTPTGLNDPDQDRSFNLYPNPASEYINITSDKELIGKSLQVYTSSGMMILDKVIENSKNHIPVSNYAKGIYYVKVSDENGQFLQRLVVQ